MLALPIDSVLPEVCAALSTRAAVVLTAPAGSGKTTRVPPALLDAGLAGDGKVVVLQPRRVAARLVARRIAQERGVRLGEEVGYQVRFDRRSGPSTRIEVLTEGLLLRRLQVDPELSEVGVVVLDEFHERSLHTDLALALLHEVIEVLRPDLRVVIMSATLDAEPVVAWLGGPSRCAHVHAPGRTFPLELRHAPRRDERRSPVRVAQGVRAALDTVPDGHVLAFLPGVGEIRATAERLDTLGVPVLPLHGRLSAAEQDRALAPSPARKVVLATNIAETSVTLPGVRAVVDSGEERAPHFVLAWQTTRLVRGPISQASADQRAGRAGRTGPGLAWRTWTAEEHRQRPARTAPEIHCVDLAGAVLELLAWGADPTTFRWVEAPAAGALAAARELLAALDAVDGRGALTPIGRQLVGLPTHPRLGRVLLAGVAAGCLHEAAGVAALSEVRDPWEGDPRMGPGLEGRLDGLDGGGAGAHRGRLAQARRIRDQLLRLGRRLEAPAGGGRGLEQALLAGFPDRVGRARGAGSHRYQLSGGAGAVLEADSVRPPELLLAVGLDAGHGGQRAEARIRLSLPLSADDLPLVETPRLHFDAGLGRVVQRRVQAFGDLVFRELPATGRMDPEAAAACLLEALRDDAEAALDPSDQARSLRRRLALLHHHLGDEGWPAPPSWTELLAELCPGRRSVAELRRADLLVPLRRQLRGRQHADLKVLAPMRFALPGGRSAAIRYDAPERPPVLAARIQQLFGLRQTPRIARGRVTLQVHLLAPNGRPAQVTSDLAHFWTHTYAEVRKELRGRYPKHAWPADPLTSPSR